MAPAAVLMKGVPLKSIEVAHHVDMALQGKMPLWAEGHSPFMIPDSPTRVERHPKDLEGVLRRDGPEWSILEKPDVLSMLGHETTTLEWPQISTLIGIEALTSILTWVQHTLSVPSEALGSR